MWRIFEKYSLLDNGIKWIASCLGSERAYATGWVTLFIPTKDKMELGLEAWNQMLDEIIETGGCPYWNGLLWEKRVLSKTEHAFLETYHTIKNALDPNDILSPQVFMEGA
jgi:FAD/FMN-containing dehydrogenase